MQPTLAGLPLPLRIKPASPLSDDQLLWFCAKHEVLRIERDEKGVLHIMTPTGNKTSNLNLYLSRMLDTWAEAEGRGLGFDSNGGFSLPDGSMRSPDAAWVSYAKWNQLSPKQQESFAPVTPDFIVELRSRTDRLPNLHRKMDKWIANGVQLAWLIDPLQKTVTIYRPGRDPEHLVTPSAVTGEGPVAGFVLPLERMFR